jgi:hypothetical protein
MINLICNEHNLSAMILKFYDQGPTFINLLVKIRHSMVWFEVSAATRTVYFKTEQVVSLLIMYLERPQFILNILLEKIYCIFISKTEFDKK